MGTNRLNTKRNLIFTGFILPAFIGYFIFYILPILLTFVYSFTDWSLFKPKMSFIGIENFTRLFQDSDVLTGIRNSVVYAILMTIFQNALAIPLAIALNQQLKSKNILRMVFFAPAVLSPLVVGYLWSYLMSSTDYGLINQLLGYMGLGPINFLGDPNIALFSVIFTQVWQWTGYAMIIYLANLQSISTEMYEAANIDGANSWQKFWKMTLPMLIPSITFNTVMSMIGGLKVFDVVFSMTKGGPGHSTETIVMTLMTKGISEGQYGYGSAFAVVFSIMIMIVVLIQLKVLKRWEDKVF
ncbi:carbohydrate ABC transporter permease [Paenibacillus sp. GCM10027629]|uniref:carbohydrate ABC transporter permease n=1 Tax=Paenibacillus sp. GCM10027629 TaxID=3273414 RepID=UPI00364163E0